MTAPVLASVRLTPAYLIRNAEMTRWTIGNTGESSWGCAANRTRSGIGNDNTHWHKIPNRQAVKTMGLGGEPTDAFVQDFTASVGFDRCLYRYDISLHRSCPDALPRGGIEHAECAAIVGGLQEIQKDVVSGNVAWSVALEDVHEHRLPAHRAHRRGRQEAPYRPLAQRPGGDRSAFVSACRDRYVMARLEALLGVLLDLAEREADTIMPGYTHLQAAQPVTLGHHLLAWFEMFFRDRGRFSDCVMTTPGQHRSGSRASTPGRGGLHLPHCARVAGGPKSADLADRFLHKKRRLPRGAVSEQGFSLHAEVCCAAPPSTGAGLRSIPTGLIPHRSPIPPGSTSDEVGSKPRSG